MLSTAQVSLYAEGKKQVLNCSSAMALLKIVGGA
jgi:hypothetical protein